MPTHRSTPLGVLPAVLVCSVLMTGCSFQIGTPPTTTTPAGIITTPQTPTTTSTPAATQQAVVTEISQSDMMNLMIDLEDQFKLQDVIASQSGTTLIVRFKAPTIGGEELSTGLAQIFAWINEKIPSQIQSVNLVFMVQNVDSLVVNVNRSDIQNWKDGKIDNSEFIKKFKKTSLL